VFEDHPACLLFGLKKRWGKLPHPRKEGLYIIAYVGIDAHTTNYTLSTYLDGQSKRIKTVSILHLPAGRTSKDHQ